jgi:hypothetical protein
VNAPVASLRSPMFRQGWPGCYSRNAPHGWNHQGDGSNMATKKFTASGAVDSKSFDSNAIRDSARKGARSVRGITRTEIEDCIGHAFEMLLVHSTKDSCSYAYCVAKNRAIRFISDRRREATASAFRTRKRSTRIRKLSEEQCRVLASVRDGMRGHLSYFVEHGIIFRDPDKERQTYRLLTGMVFKPEIEVLGGKVPYDAVERLVAYRLRYFPKPVTLDERVRTTGRRSLSLAEYEASHRRLGLTRTVLNGQELPLQTQYRHSKHAPDAVITRRLVNEVLGMCGLREAIHFVDRVESRDRNNRRKSAVRLLEKADAPETNTATARNPLFKARKR